MISVGDIEYRYPGETYRPAPVLTGPLTVEPPEVPPEVEAEIRAHVRTALRRVGWPPEPIDDYGWEAS